MNIDHLIRTIKKNYHRLKDENLALNFVRYQLELLDWKKKKLKLGAIVFEVKETYFNGVLLFEEVDIRYIRQDNTETDNLKIENRLKALGWKWDLKNILAGCVVCLLVFYNIWTYLQNWYCQNLPSLAYKPDHYDFVIRHGIESSFKVAPLDSMQSYLSLNYWLTSIVADFCVYFNVIL